ncbi:MAG: permease [Bacteroidota bacterium]
MNPALQKTLVFLLLIAAGYFLQKKINGKQELKGVKVLILSVILPATIFVALLKIKISAELLALPVLALGLNFALFYAARFALPRLGFGRDTPGWRTMSMLVPSLAPGLSCFPFVLEYLGESSLALAALADVGNKIFVLVILYVVAMNWYYRLRGANKVITADDPGRREKLKDLGLSLLREPVNLVIVAAIALLSFGLDITALPTFLESTAVRLAALMTPIVLLFIGMAVRFERREMALILRVLAFRSGTALLLSSVFLLIYPPATPAFALLAVIFPQSATSFWPFAHMSAVEGQRAEGEPTVFNIDLALNVLACSLPFSTVVILSILSCGNFFASPLATLPLAGALLLLPLYTILRKRREKVSTTAASLSAPGHQPPQKSGAVSAAAT